MSTDQAQDEVSVPSRAPIWAIPIFIGLGLFSSLFAGRFCFNFWGAKYNAYLYEVLASAGLGLAIVAILWWLRQIQTWSRALAVVVAAVAGHTLEQFLDPHLLQDKAPLCWGCPPAEHFAAGSAARLFLVAFILYFVTLAASVRPGFLRPLVISLAGAAIAAETIGRIIPAAQLNHLDLVINGVPLDILWQLVLGSYLGVAVWVNGIRLNSSSVSRSGRGNINRFTAFYVLAAYVLAVGAADFRVNNASRRRVDSINAAIAGSKQEAPAMVDLRQVEPLSLDQVLIMNSIGGWKPYLSNSGKRAGRLASAEVTAAPSTVDYSVSYAAPPAPPSGGYHADHFEVEISQYPNADWARYELRNRPMPNELLKHPERVQLVSEFGGKFYVDEWMYRYWSSGDKLIFLDCEGIPPQDIEIFLKAYLSKYPSSIQ